jgi:acyl-coenzyme A synthetase/AMP-(fatty) acid ligase
MTRSQKADMQLPPMHDYEDLCRTFRWHVPAHFNWGSDVVDAWARRQPDHTALIWCNAAGEELRLSYADIARLSNRCAAALAQRGVVKGDRVLIMLPRVPEWQIAMVGCLKLGAVPIPCIDMLTARDMAYRASHSGARAAITNQANTGKLAGLGSPLDVRLAVGGDDGFEDFARALAEAPDGFAAATVAAEDPAIIYYTSGSTGHPKGVTHASRALFAWRVAGVYWNELSPDDVTWCTADTGWSKAGTSVLFGPWSCGSTVLTYDGPFDPAQRLHLLQRHRVTVFCAAATELNRLLNLDLQSWNLSALRRTISAGETVSAAVQQRWTQAFGRPIYESYGQTENLITVGNFTCMPVKPGSMGRPMPGSRMEIIDDSGRIVPRGEIGHIAMGLPNPQLMLGYRDDPERTRQAQVHGADGHWFITGDLGRMDDHGYVFYEGRADDIINSAGYRIGPAEVENVLLEHPAVQECAAVPSPDADRGEVVKAFIVLRSGIAGDEALAGELREHCKRLTAPYKYPRRIEFVASLPKTVTGKISRRELKALERSKVQGAA